jgi:hypothetical protein
MQQNEGPILAHSRDIVKFICPTFMLATWVACRASIVDQQAKRERHLSVPRPAKSPPNLTFTREIVKLRVSSPRSGKSCRRISPLGCGATSALVYAWF